MAALLCVSAPANAATCSAGYYLSGDTCAQCPSGKYCENDAQKDCPDAVLHQRTSFPETYYNPKIIRTDFNADPGLGAISQCRVLSWMESSRGELYEYALYNTTTGKYDNRMYYGWGAVMPGYYLTNKSACGIYAYYYTVTECPAGSYCPGKKPVTCNSSNQATVHTTTFGLETCPAGYYCPTGASAPTPCPAGTYSNVTSASDASVCKACTNATYSDHAGATECTICPTATALKDRVTSYWYWSIDNVHDHQGGCRATITEEDSRGDYLLSCGICGGDYGVDPTCSETSCLADQPVKCIGGYYWNSGDPNRYIWASNVENIKSVACVPAGPGYWSTADSLTRTACPASTTTIGYGPGADEAADCGVALHIGDATVHLRSEQRTTPALHVRVGNQTFYGDMTTEAKGRVRIKIDNTVYSVYDDSM